MHFAQLYALKIENLMFVKLSFKNQSVFTWLCGEPFNLLIKNKILDGDRDRSKSMKFVV